MNADLTDTSLHVPEPAVLPAPEDIALRAYALYELRGCVPGYDVQDWLEAEHQLLDEQLNRTRVPRHRPDLEPAATPPDL